MALPSEQSPQSITDKSVVVMYCGPSQKITGPSLVEKQTQIVTADGKERIVSTHMCTKTYFVRTRTGEVVTLTVPFLFLRGLPQDLLEEISVNRQSIRVIFDAKPDICGLYSLDKDKEQQYQTPFSLLVSPRIYSICKPKPWIGQRLIPLQEPVASPPGTYTASEYQGYNQLLPRTGGAGWKEIQR